MTRDLWVTKHPYLQPVADWTSLHLDIVARDRGLKRMAASLYTLGA